MGLRHLVMAILLAALCKPAHLSAQFLGGDGDGIALVDLANTDPCPYFFGDSADGHASILLPNPDSCLPFWGDVGDGFASELLPNPDTCGYFEGSSEDGYASTLLPNPDSCGFFEGLEADGFALGEFFSPVPCPTFYGATADGFSFGELICAPLAVTASELEGRIEGNDGYLWWYTYMEINNLGFSLQRSTDRFEWVEIAFLPGLDQSNQVRKYEHLDTSIPFGPSYYRWVQMDLDGSTSRSNIVTLVRDQSGQVANFQVYPVPVAQGELLRIRFENGRPGTLLLRLTDLYGRVLTERTEANDGGKIEVDLPMVDLSAGTYLLSIEQEGRRWTKRVMVL